MYVDSSMRFYEFYNDKMTKREFQLMSEFLVSLSDMGQCPVPLSGTPLNEVIMLGIDLVNEFKAQYGLDICNTILLTDGDSSSGAGVATFETYMYDGIPRRQKRYHQVSDNDVCTYQHRKTGTVWTKPTRLVRVSDAGIVDRLPLKTFLNSLRSVLDRTLSGSTFSLSSTITWKLRIWM